MYAHNFGQMLRGYDHRRLVPVEWLTGKLTLWGLLLYLLLNNVSYIWEYHTIQTTCNVSWTTWVSLLTSIKKVILTSCTIQQQSNLVNYTFHHLRWPNVMCILPPSVPLHVLFRKLTDCFCLLIHLLIHLQKTEIQFVSLKPPGSDHTNYVCKLIVGRRSHVASPSNLVFIMSASVDSGVSPVTFCYLSGYIWHITDSISVLSG